MIVGCNHNNVRHSFIPRVYPSNVYIWVQVNFVLSEIESDIAVGCRNWYKSKSNLNLNLGTITLECFHEYVMDA